mmetsp:Transcript_7620/g.16320  ORF Transcript_7620/g.16320 Transcript_7620/m.16320 type:complete len:314 (-) Transcript_7620:565-1506(-)
MIIELWLINFEIIVVVVRLILVGIHAHFVRIITIGDCGINTDLSTILMVDGAYFEAVFGSSQQTRLLTSVAAGSSSHDGCLDEDAGSTVGIGSFLGIHGWEGNRILIILSQMKMSRKPTLDRSMFPHQLNKLSAIPLIRVVQPATSIHHMIFLNDPNSRSIGRSVREHEDTPSLVRRFGLQQILKPTDLIAVDNDLVGGIFGITEERGAQPNQQGLFCNLTAKLRCFLAMAFEKSSKIFGIRVEFVDSFEVVIAANDFVGDAKGGEIFGCNCVALSGASEEFVGIVGIVVATFGFAEVAQRDEGDAVFADFRF